MLGFNKSNTGTDCDAIAREIAEACAARTLRQLDSAAEQMSAAQLRGYVRAHAWKQVWDKVLDVAASGRITRSQTKDLAGKVLEQTVHLVTGAYLIAPVAIMPAPHIERRAAA